MGDSFKNCAFNAILISLISLSELSFSDDILFGGGSHARPRGIGENPGTGAGGFNNGMGAFGNANGRAAGGGMGAGSGGAGGGVQYKPNADAKALDPTKPNENIKKIEESAKQFSQTVDKLTSSFNSSLDKLKPQDDTAQTLKEVTDANEKYAAIGRSPSKANDIVDDIVKGITTRADTNRKEWEAVLSGLTAPTSQPARQPAAVSTTNRINNLGASNRNTNPLATIMGAEPAKTEKHSEPQASGSSGSGQTETQRGFFKGSAAYNPPTSAK